MEILNNNLNELNNNKNINNTLEKIEEKTQNFLETKLGQVVNNAIDFGLKAVLPNWLENDIIEIKDTVFNDGFKQGVQLAIDKAINMGKAIEGIFTGNFESVSQIKSVIKSGGLLDTLSKLLDSVINFAKDEKIISSSTARLIKSNKNLIMENIENSIDNSLLEQAEAVGKIDGYIEKWQSYFENKDFTNMKKTYNKIEKQMKDLVPIKSVLEKVQYVENLQQLIENNGKNFDLSEEELELAKMLS